MEGDPGGTFSKVSDLKLLILLNIKSNKTQAAQMRNTMQSQSTFAKISGPIPEVKKSG